MAARTRSTRRKSRRKTKSQKQAEQNVILGILFTGFVMNSFLNHPVWIAPTAVIVISFFFAYKRITRHHHRRRLLLKNLDDLSSDGYEFEERIRLLLVDLGWKDIRRVGGGGDGGVDLVAWYGKYKYIVQCKYYQSGKSVGSPAIRDLIGAKEDQKAYQALFVTSSHFSEPARETATRNDIKLWDRTVGKRRLAWCAWTVFITNVSADRLTVAEILTLARARWQIELLIKLWKRHGTVDESRSQKPYRVLCDVYAKLLAMVVQHWLFLVNLWAYPERSLVKAAKTVKRRAIELARSFRKRHRLIETITSIGQCITGCRINRRKQEPNTYQLLLDASLLGIGMPDGQA